MIYIHRDWAVVPDEVKAELKSAAADLDAIDEPDKRKEYIEKHQAKWSTVREYLSGMSANKCWYSEARESVSRYEVDHFRPHGRAKQAVKTFADGYSWLAFDLDNFRLAGMLCNRVNKEYSEESVGKGDWFPLGDPATRATFQNRSTHRETPVLLDPADPDDPSKLWFNEDGNVVPDPGLEESEKLQIEAAIGYLGLRQSFLNHQRARVLNRCRRTIKRYKAVQKVPKGQRTQRDTENMNEARNELLAMSSPTGEFAAAVRCFLIANGLKGIVVRDELKPLALPDTEV
jgi:hypothetical protein